MSIAEMEKSLDVCVKIYSKFVETHDEAVARFNDSPKPCSFVHYIDIYFAGAKYAGTVPCYRLNMKSVFSKWPWLLKVKF